jgi:hypothetical protein
MPGWVVLVDTKYLTGPGAAREAFVVADPNAQQAETLVKNHFRTTPDQLVVARAPVSDSTLAALGMTAGQLVQI